MNSASGIEKDINKLLKKVKLVTPKERLELHHIIGGLYTDIGCYEEAKEHHEEALQLCLNMGDPSAIAISYRLIGEAKAALGLFEDANKDIQRYLSLSQKSDDKIEIQRALTTLGRVELMQAQQMKDEGGYHRDIKKLSREAHKMFNKALEYTELIKERVEPKEFDQMRAGLLLNIGLVKDLCNKKDESIAAIMEARHIYKRSKLKEDLYRCLNLLSSICRANRNFKKASDFSKEGLETAKQVGKKILICDALIELGLVQINQRQFKEAKRSFKFAYRENSPNDEDQLKALRYWKIAQLISDTFNKLNEHEDLSCDLKRTYAEKLGDLYVKIGCFGPAVDYYILAIQQARLCQKPKAEIAKILYSLAETYADNVQYEKALKCFEKELSISKEENSRSQTLFRMAQLQDLLDQKSSIVCEAYEKALDASSNNISTKSSIITCYLAYMKDQKCNMIRYREILDLKEKLDSYITDQDSDAGNERNAVNDEDELEDEIDCLNVEEIVSDNDEDDEVLVVGRRRASTKRFKTNELGETPLHEATIRGDIKRVKSLLDQGHEVNPRDNAGWTPLHEACNHGHLEIARLLIEKGADVSNSGPEGMTPLHDAATNGHFDVMELLIKSKANVISLTSTGATVLACLRDYKSRKYSDMTNDEMSQYKRIETDLRHLMDKCGFDVMSHTDNINSKSNRVDVVVSNAIEPTQEPKVKPSITSNDLTSETSVVKDYKNTLGYLKRKRISPEPKQQTKKKSFPATYEADFDPSAATKDWLIDDVTRASRRRNLIRDLENRNMESSSDEDQMSNIEQASGPTHYQLDSSPDGSPQITSSKTKSSVLEIFLSDEDSQLSSVSKHDASRSRSRALVDKTSSTNDSRNSKKIDLKKEDRSHVYVHLESLKLLVPISDPKYTVKWLKGAIVDRFASVNGDRPDISIAPIDDPECVIFEDDSCEIFLGKHIVAKILSWNLDGMVNIYKSKCQSSEPKIVPLDLIISELSRLSNSEKLDLSHIRIPNQHVSQLSCALRRRDFKQVKLSCSPCLFDTAGQSILDCICSWDKLISLEMKCVGLVRHQFELLCKRLRANRLESIDLSYNCISFRCKQTFLSQIENLIISNQSLKRLILTQNQLIFTPALEEKEYGDIQLIADSQNDYIVTQCDY